MYPWRPHISEDDLFRRTLPTDYDEALATELEASVFYAAKTVKKMEIYTDESVAEDVIVAAKYLDAVLKGLQRCINKNGRDKYTLKRLYIVVMDIKINKEQLEALLWAAPETLELVIGSMSIEGIYGGRLLRPEYHGYSSSSIPWEDVVDRIF